MAYSFTFHHDLNLVYKRVWGSYGNEDSKRAHEYWDVASQGEVGKFNELQDLREVTDYGVSADQIRSLAEHYEDAWNAGDRTYKRMAYVAPSPVVFGTGRIYSTLISSTGLNFQVFESINEAADWLEISAVDLDMVLSRSVSPDFVEE